MTFYQGIRFARLEKLSKFLQTLPRSTLVHFEMASFTEIGLLTEIIQRVIYYCDSLGANEQVYSGNLIIRIVWEWIKSSN